MARYITVRTIKTFVTYVKTLIGSFFVTLKPPLGVKLYLYLQNLYAVQNLKKHVESYCIAAFF